MSQKKPAYNDSPVAGRRLYSNACIASFANAILSSCEPVMMGLQKSDKGGTTKMKNKVAVVLLAVGMGVSMAACADTDGTQASPAASTEVTAEAATTDSAEIAGTENTQDVIADESKEGTSDSVTVSGNVLTTPYFAVTIPSDWNGDYSWDVYQSSDDNVESYTLNFYCTAAKDNGEGGFVCGVVYQTAPPEFIEFVGGDFICGVKADGSSDVDGYVAVSFPTDVQCGEGTQSAYETLYNSVDKLENSIVLPEGAQRVDMTYAESMASVERETYGVIADASMHSFTMVTYAGEFVTISGEDISTGNLAGGIQVGHCYSMKYKGLLGADGDASNITFESLENTDAQTPEKDYEAMYTASQVQLALHMESLDMLAGVCSFPLTLDGRQIASAEEFTGLRFADVVSDDLARNVQYCSLYDAEVTGDSFSISLLGEAPEVVISKTADGYWVVTSIRNL